MDRQKHNIGPNSIEVIEVSPEKVAHEHPILFVHGSWGGAWMWDSYVEYFGKQGFKMYAFSLRGHAESGGEVDGATMNDYVDDIHTVVGEMDIADPYIVGHSMGGLLVLMYSKDAPVGATVSINPSPSLEILGEGREVTYPREYTPIEAGMPEKPEDVMKTFPDIPKEVLSKMESMLGKESGVARSERKKGVSIKRDELTSPLLFVGTEDADSVPFGIGVDKTRQMADYYEGDFIEIEGATHPGILVGENALVGAEKIYEWLTTVPKK